MADWNRVTERPLPARTIWMVSAEWRGGHDMRIFRVDNIYEDEKTARAEWADMTPENHSSAFGLPIGTDGGFKRHPLREYQLRD